MKSRKLTIGLLLLVAFIFTTGTFAYWASGAAVGTSDTTGTVTIGAGDELTSTVTVNAQSNLDGNLVPVGRTGTGEVDNVDLTFPVQWTVDGTEFDGATGSLAVSFGDILIGTTDVSSLFTIAVTTPASMPTSITEDAAAQDIIINIEFTTEPADKTMYDIVANGSLVFDVTFTVTP